MAGLPDTGSRTAFDTGAVRDSMQGKGLPSMIPTCAIMAMAKRFEDGATKYGPITGERVSLPRGIVTQLIDILCSAEMEICPRITSEQCFGISLVGCGHLKLYPRISYQKSWMIYNDLIRRGCYISNL